MATRRPMPPFTHVIQRRGRRRGQARPAAPPRSGVAPPCPPWMDIERRLIWEKVTGALDEGGVLGSVDGTALAQYVSMVVQWRHLATFLQEHGETHEVRHTYRVPARVDADGTVIPRQAVETTRQELRPQAQLALALAERLLRLEQQWGLSPASGASIGRELTAARQATSGHPLTLDPRRFLRLRK